MHEVGHSEEVYEAMMGNPDLARWVGLTCTQVTHTTQPCHMHELGHSEEAYEAMMGNPGPARWVGLTQVTQPCHIPTYIVLSHILKSLSMTVRL